MNVFKIISVSFILLFNGAYGQIKNNKYDESLSKIIFSNYHLKSKLTDMLELNNGVMKVFKVLISRRDHFVRISILQIINKEELNELPSSYFTFKTNTFLCYNGSEIIANNRIDKAFVEKLKPSLRSRIMNDTRVFQFDLNSEKTVTIHVPAINPYDLTETIRKKF